MTYEVVWSGEYYNPPENCSDCPVYFFDVYTLNIWDLFYNSYHSVDFHFKFPSDDLDCLFDEYHVFFGSVCYDLVSSTCWSTDGKSWYYMNSYNYVGDFINDMINRRVNYGLNENFFVGTLFFDRIKDYSKNMFYKEVKKFYCRNFFYDDDTGYYYIDFVYLKSFKMCFHDPVFVYILKHKYINNDFCFPYPTLHKIRSLIG